MVLNFSSSLVYRTSSVKCISSLPTKEAEPLEIEAGMSSDE